MVHKAVEGNACKLKAWKCILRNIIVAGAMLVLLMLLLGSPCLGSLMQVIRLSSPVQTEKLHNNISDQAAAAGSLQILSWPSTSLEIKDMSPEEELEADAETREKDFDDKNVLLPETFINLESEGKDVKEVKEVEQKVEAKNPYDHYFSGLQNYFEPEVLPGAKKRPIEYDAFEDPPTNPTPNNTGPRSYDSIDRATDTTLPLSNPVTEKTTPNINIYSFPDTTAVIRPCDFTVGKWALEPTGPLYSYNKCRVTSPGQNCRANGRLDNEYEFYKWQPHQCSIPGFDAETFLRLMSGRTLAFIGDSLARNQMESLLCILLRVSSAKSYKSNDMHRWHFTKYNFTIVRIWSPWLVKSEGDFPPSFSPPNVRKLNLTELDDYATHLPKFDVIILSSGHSWIRKPSSFFMDGEIQGGVGWQWPSNSTDKPEKMDHVEAFGIAMKTAFTKIGSYPGYKGVTILRSYIPDHYLGGNPNAIGSCSGETGPYETAPENSQNERMRDEQLKALKASKKRGETMPNGSRLKLMDVYALLNLRGDGHPGSYRKSGNGTRPDCLHWCLPGPIDTINEILLYVLLTANMQPPIGDPSTTKWAFE